MAAPSAKTDAVATDEAQLRRASALLGVPFVRLVPASIPPAVLELIPEDVARSSGMVAYDQETLASGRRVLHIAVSDPKALEVEAPPAVLNLHARKGLVIDVALAPKQDVADVLARYRRPVSSPAIQPAAKISKPVDSATSKQPEPTATSASVGPTKNSSPAGSLPTIDLTGKDIPKTTLERIPPETAKKYRVVVFGISEDGQRLQIAVADPANPQVQEFLAFIRHQTHLQVDLFQASAASIDHGLSQYQASSGSVGASPPKKKPEKLPSKPLSPLRPLPSPQSAAEPTSRAAPALEELAEKEEAHPPIAAQPMLTVSSDQTKAHPTGVATTAETSLLIPMSADVERDLEAVVGQPIKSTADLEAVIRTGFIPKIVGAIILLAAKMNASDIHIQADDEHLLVRYRIDGLLNNIVSMPVTLQAPVVSRIKILARLKIDEQRIPQDGRFDVLVEDKQIDLRVSTFPTVKGEKIVIRLLDKSRGALKLEELGFAGSRLERLRKEFRKPYGVILSTGPTGSGKSTTLYAVIQEIIRPEINIVTLEDPVEYEIPGISQAQIKPKIGFGFGEGLRAILRQDPNVIMVGEVRDLETASMMTHAALTGHLVLSTLHTNDASGAMPRLVNMGVEPFLITSAMNGIVAQRLVRRLCPKCRQSWQPSAEIIKEIQEKLREGNNPELQERLNKELTFWKAVGCDACHDGYKGRVGIFEVLVMSEAVEDLVIKKASASDIAKTAIAEGMVTMEQDGLLKVLDGATTLDEVLRVTKTE